MLHVAAVGFIGLAALGCASDQPATAPSPPSAALEPRPDPPPPAPPGALRIEVGAVTTDRLVVYPLPVGCPSNPGAPDGMMPCRHFEVVAPGDGVLDMEVLFIEDPDAEPMVRLIIAGADHPTNTFNRTVGSHRVLAGATYGITVVYAPTHSDYLWFGHNLIGELTLKPRFQPKQWK